LFAIIRAARTRRWLWFSLMVAAGIVVLISYLIPFNLAQPLLYYPFLLVLLVFGLFGPRRPYRPPAKQRPAHSGVLTTSWIIPLALYYGLAVDARPTTTSEGEAAVALAIVCAAILAGDVMGLARAWRARSWAWGIALALLLILSLGVIPVSVF